MTGVHTLPNLVSVISKTYRHNPPSVYSIPCHLQSIGELCTVSRPRVAISSGKVSKGRNEQPSLSIHRAERKVCDSVLLRIRPDLIARAVSRFESF